MIGSKLYQDLAILDPATLTWSQVASSGKIDGFNSEEGWVLLPDASVFTADVKNAPASERFLLTGPDAGMWVSSGTSLQDLHTPTTSSPLTAPGCPTYYPPGEMGPSLLRPDGTVFVVGADGYTGIYTPPAAGSAATGSWTKGPQMPAGLNVEDGPAAVLPSGHVLFGGSPGESGGGLQYFEFDGTNLIGVPVPSRGSGDATYYTSLLVLPSGQVLFVDSSSTVQLYTPAASPTYNPAWAPTIGSVPSTINGSTTVQISGTQFNGLNQGTAFGDESENATNYPLVRITNAGTGHVFYAKTHGHSSMGVATGSTVISTNFDVPATIEAGASAIQVVANGIPSAPVSITVINAISYPTTTTLSASPNPSVFGQAVTFSARVTSSGGVPSGTVTFSQGSTVLDSNVPVGSNGYATFSTTALAVGSDIVTAAFTGATGWLNSSGTAAAEVVNKAATTTSLNSSANPAVFGQTITFTAVVSASGGVPAGTVAFRNGGTTLGTGTLDAGGHATFSTSTLKTGPTAITAVYSGNADFNTSTSANVNQTVNTDGTTTSVTSSIDPSAPNQQITFTATVAANAPGGGIPGGNVTFMDGPKNLGNGSLNASGVATYKISNLAAGTHQIKAVYQGGNVYATSTSAVLVQTVN
jgi:hypothetical protein